MKASRDSLDTSKIEHNKVTEIKSVLLSLAHKNIIKVGSASHGFTFKLPKEKCIYIRGSEQILFDEDNLIFFTLNFDHLIEL